MAKYASDLDATNHLNSKKHGSVMQGILVEGGHLNRLLLVFGQGICCWRQQLLFLVTSHQSIEFELLINPLSDSALPLMNKIVWH
jgi:hypothetical protein